MKILKTAGWEEYSLLDSGGGARLEQFGKFRLVRPDPQCLWSRSLDENAWEMADAVFEKDANGKERWVIKKNVPEKWLMKYKDLSFYAKLTPFKHTGIFPEQHLMWEWMDNKIKDPAVAKAMAGKQKSKILNLFAYTGIASLAAACAGCEVTHVDASSPSIGWARENQAASNLVDKPIRWIREDILKYCEREVRRGQSDRGGP